MQFDDDTENSGNPPSGEQTPPVEDALEWLVDQDLDSAPDSLFKLEQEEHTCAELTEFEAEVASRPMIGGGAGKDDLSLFVEEEIVLSADPSSSIYTSEDSGADSDAGSGKSSGVALPQPATSAGSVDDDSEVGVEEGVDILELSEQDTMGEQHLSLKRVRRNSTNRPPPKAHLQTNAQSEPPAAAQGDDELELPDLQELLEQHQPPPSTPLADEMKLASSAQAEAAAAQPADVKAYVDSKQPPADELEFDQYLLEGEHLDAEDLALDELVLGEAGAEDASIQQGDEEIDYHEDFRTLDGFDDNAVIDLPALVGPIMDELSTTVRERLVALGLAGDAVVPDLMLGTDRAAIIQCVAEGYVPLQELVPQLPTAMLGLPLEQSGAVYLRLTHQDTGASWNRLLQPDFNVPGGDSFDGIEFPGAETPVAQESATLEPGPGLSIAAPAAEEELVIDIPQSDAEQDTETWAEFDLGAVEDFDFAAASKAATVDTNPAALDVDAFLSDETSRADDSLESEFTALLSASTEQDAGIDTPQQQQELSTDDSMLSPPVDDDVVPEQTAVDHSQNTGVANDEAAAFNIEDFLVPPADELLAAEAEEGPASEAAADSDIDKVFDDNLFSTDLSDELSAEVPDESLDFDALIEGLSQADDAGGQVLDDDVVALAAQQFEPEDRAEPEPAVAAESAPDEALAEAPWRVPDDIEFAGAEADGAEIFHDFLDAFNDEGASELEKLEDAIAQWEQAPQDEAAFAPVPRVLHTLKGIATGVGLVRYGALIHNFETLLEQLPRMRGGDQAPYFQVINQWLDATTRGFDHIRQHREDIDQVIPEAWQSGAVEQAEAVEEQRVAEESAAAEDGAVAQQQAAPAVEEAAPAPEQPTVAPVLVKPPPRDPRVDKKLADEGAKALAAQQTIRIAAGAVDHLMNLTNQAQQLGVRSSQSNMRGKRTAAELVSRLSSVRSHIAKIADRTLLNVASSGEHNSELDALEMDQYSELQEAANILREAVEDLDDLVNVSSRHMNQAEALMKQQAASLSALRSAIQAARVVPVSRLMPGLRRIVRTVGADLNKAVSFTVLNEQGALDRDNHARCQIILEHMVRNAVDHGIETPEQRSVAGKPVNGKITIDVGKDGSDYIITLADDGRGIDPDFMRTAAYDKGLDIDVDELSDDEAVRLIFHKGFSTADSLSEISGRGVGMDIVLSELQEIGGDIGIQSVVGEGTSFTIRVPSNVSLNGALLVSAAEKSYAIPLTGLIAIEHVDVHAFYNAVAAQAQVSVAGMQCEPAYLATLCDGIGLPDRGSWGATLPVIIAGSDQRRMAIAIDDVQQALELVVRSLGSQFSLVPGLAGAATTADGQAIVALDLNALVQSAAQDEALSATDETATNEGLLVLVVDDSRTQRMVATSQFDTLGVETVTAENGLVAIDLLNSTHRLPDVVLLDVEMPVQDGIQTLREIRNSQRFSDLPVIMVTSRTGAKHRALAKEAGCDGYMGKPFNFPALVEEICELTGAELKIP